MTERPEQPDETVEDAVLGTDRAAVPAATGSTTTYTTGTLQHGDAVPAIDKPDHEDPTQGEGPIEDPVQAASTEEFREARQNRDQ